MNRRDLESIEEAIFKESLEHSLNIKDLGKLYVMLIRMRVQILDITTEDNLTLQEVGEIWFRITESILNVRIMIREKIGIDVSQDVEGMKRLWERCNGTDNNKLKVTKDLLNVSRGLIKNRKSRE